MLGAQARLRASEAGMVSARSDDMPKTTPLCIRSAVVSDAGEIARLSAELGYPNEAKDIESRLGILLTRQNYWVSVATADEPGLIGWIAAEHRLLLEYGERVEIVGLVVATTARRSGAGAALVASAEQWAAGQGVAIISVRSNIARVESHPFYERIGYVRRKTQHAYSKELLLPPTPRTAQRSVSPA